MPPASLLAALLAAAAGPALSRAQAPLVLDGAAAHHAWDGFGGLSAGASSRLLFDYPAPQLADILDLLYRPSFGASLQICKIEIGGDVMSTDGTEASHMHARGDLSCDRGYELRLAREAVARNAKIKTFALAWGVPGWVGNGSFFSQENLDYQAAFATCFLEKVGRPLDYIGIWNERSWGSTDYVVGLRRTLDAAGHASTKIVVPDCAVAGDPALIAAITTNATFDAAIAVAGLHGDPVPVPILEQRGVRYWQSETGFDPISLEEDWAGARAWARNLNRNYISANITGTVTWSTVWSVLPGLPYDGRGIMMANTPWSGNYRDSAPLWVSAHFGQFLEIGWRHLLTGRGAGLLPPGDSGSYCAFVPPDALDALTLVVESMGVQANSTRAFSLAGGLPGAGTVFSVWQTTDAARFVRMPDVSVAADGTLTLAIPADAIVTASTVRSASHGVPAAPVPPPAPLALPYADDFSACAYALPRYLSDQGGSFACRNGSLAQVVTQRPGANDWYVTPDPITLLGDYAPWADVSVAATASMPPLTAPGERDDTNAFVGPCEASPSAHSPQTWSFDTPYPKYVANTVSGESICLNLYGCEARLIYYQCCAPPCGCSESAGFDFALNADGTLTAALLPGLCAALLADNTTVSMVACVAGAPAQQWARLPTRQLRNAASGACLTSPLAPSVPYVQVCARVTAYSGFDGLAPVPGYCLRLGADGGWSVRARNETLANGTLASGPPGGAPTRLVLAARGDTVSASVGSSALGSWPGRTMFSAGLVAMGSGVHEASFDDLLVEPL